MQGASVRRHRIENIMKTLIRSLVALVSVVSVSFAHCGGCEAKKKASASASVGKPAPAFALKTAAGAEVSLEALKGKVIVLEWVNFGCPFVKKHYSGGHMQALQKEYAEKDVVWMLVSSANTSHPTYLAPADLEAKAKEQKAMAQYALVDADGAVGKAYGAKTTPHMYVIGKDGVLAYAGAIDSKKSTNAADIAGSENYVVAALDAVLAGEEVKTPETKAYGCSVKY